MLAPHYPLPRRVAVRSGVGPRTDLPIRGYAYFPSTAYSVRPRRVRSSVPPSLSETGAGILTCFPSATPFGFALGPD